MKKKVMPDLFVSPREFFAQVVAEAAVQRKLRTLPIAQQYLVNVLEQFMLTETLFEDSTESGKKIRPTLAEMFLKAMNSSEPTKSDLLKKLGDTTLYVGGFFGESLQRKVVDLDYYIQMGGNAYESLAHCVKEDTNRKIYHELSKRFLDYMDLLTYISQKSLVQSNTNLLRLYEVYLRTGSDLARDQLLEKGLIQPDRKSAGNKGFKQ